MNGLGRTWVAGWLLAGVAASSVGGEVMSGGVPADWRHADNGREIPTEYYSDQPYLVRTGDGAWLCTVTTGGGEEGHNGQHVVAMRSTDQGRTWSVPVDVEPAEGPEASYAVLLRTPSGRIYCFYNHNTDHVREVKCEDGNVFKRVDSLGHYVFKFSDDDGRTWSASRYEVPVREFRCDRENVYGGALRFFWNVGRPLVVGDAAYMSLHKVGAMGVGFFAQSEGVLLKSDNILTEQDPAKIRWETLPDGDVGLRTPAGGGRVSEEQSYSVLSDGTLYVVYRSVDGYPVESYSRDGGHTWSAARYKCFADGRRMKHPRAANFAWRCENGQWLYWFHNHGGRFVPKLDPTGFEDRNPVWVSAGREIDTPAGRELSWSEPEILLYEDDPFVRMSYPDLLEEDGKVYVTETNKDRARVHELDRAFLEALWGQHARREVAREGLLLELPVEGSGTVPGRVAGPMLPNFSERDPSQADYGLRDKRAGFTLDLWIRMEAWTAGQELLSNRTPDGRGFVLRTVAAGAVELEMSDGRTVSRWACDAGAIATGQPAHVVVVVDGGPKIVTFVTNGRLNDGGDERQFGWGRFSPLLRHVNGTPEWRVGAGVEGEILGLRVYGRRLMTTEAVGNWRAGR